MFQKDVQYLFFLAVLLILGAYFAGLSTDAQVFFKGLDNLGFIFTGRNPATGQLAGYPSNAPTVNP